MEDSPVTSKSYTKLLKYCEFVGHKIKELEEAGIISQSMSDWASPKIVVPKNEEYVHSNDHLVSSRNGKFNMWLCICRNFNSQIQTVCLIKADGSLGNVISNYPLPSVDSILAHFNTCNFFTTIDLRS